MTEKLRKIKWINVVLFFSLAVNFFVAGYYASDAAMFKKLHKQHKMHKRPEIRIVDYFPQEEKMAFRRLMLEQRKMIAPVKRDIFESQKEILELLAVKEIDEARFRQAFRKYQDSNDHLQTMLNEMIIEMVLKMDYQTRRQVFQRGQRAHERRNIMKGQARLHLREKKRFEEPRGAPPEPEGSKLP